MNAYFHGIPRTDWGFGNPNKTAALIATLMVSVWILAYIKQKGLWAALGLFTALGLCLIHTFSRGGVIAALGGLMAIIPFLSRPWAKSRVLSVIASLGILIGYSIYLEAHERFAQGVKSEDRSITNRLEIWKKASQMMVDAPTGWGLGNSGTAYMQWYQAPERTEGYRTLVNSHLTWLVEIGWGWRYLYLIGWGLIFGMCWPSKKSRWFAIPLGVWVAFGIASFFSSVAESPFLWIIPLVCLFSVLISRFWRKDYPTRVQYLIPVIAASLILCLILFLGRGDTNVRGSAKSVILGRNPPELWIVAGPKILGKEFGKPLRQWFTYAQIDVGIVTSIDDIPSIKDKIVVFGASASPNQLLTLGKGVPLMKKIILVNPNFSPPELNIPKESMGKVHVVFGEFSQSTSINSWTQTLTPIYIQGVGDFLPNWTESILEKQL